MDNQYKTPEERRAERLKLAQRQRMIRAAAILLAIVLSLVSLIQSCRTQKAIEDLAAQLAARKAAEAQALLEAQTQEEEQTAAGITAVSGDNSITLSFVGDVTLCSADDAEYTGSFEACYDTYGESCFFENVKSIFEGDDLTVANLECVMATSGTRVQKSTTFRADPSYVSILLDGSIDAVNIASDHTYDYGDEGHVDTIAHLDNADIHRFGNNYTNILTLDGIAVGFAGIDETSHGVGSQEELEKDIAALKEAGAQLIIVSIHWGEEGADSPNALQISLGHAAIDAGADLVVGHHPGNLQGIEYYNGKYICYSLGTFITGEGDVEDTDTVIFQQTFTLKGDTVTAEKDVNIIPCSLNDAEANRSYCPTPVSGEEADRIMNRIYTLSSELEGGITA